MIKFRRDPPTHAQIGVAIYGTTAVAYLIRRHHSSHQHDQQRKLLTPSLSLIVIAIGAFFLFVEPIPQPQSYHNFADKRVFVCSCHAYSEGFFLPPNERRRGFAIPNFGDVVSNVFILMGGLFGVILNQVTKSNALLVNPARKWQLEVCLPIFFYSTILISLGSTYYHWKPTDKSLVWDRLPMTSAFVSIFCFIVEEYTSLGFGQEFLFPLLGVGIFSIIYWRWTDDLRLYAIVQFLPLLIIAVLMAWGDPKHGGKTQHEFALTCYALAKYCEDRDYEIFEFIMERISGHSLKHSLAGVASILIASTIYS